MTNSKVKVTIRSLFASYLLAAILLILLAFLLYQFHLKESQVGIAVTAIYVITCFIGGMLMGKGMKQRRFFWGFLLGAMYFAILFAASYFMGKGLPMDMGQVVRTFIICAASGTIGGMLS